MNKESLTIEQARELQTHISAHLGDIMQGGRLNDLLGNLYTSDMLSEWKFQTEKGFDAGRDAIDGMISAWVKEHDKQAELANTIDDYGWAWELHGFRNGVKLAWELFKELGQPVPGR